MDNEAKIEKKKRQFNPDRIVLEPKSVEVIRKFSEQIGSAFNGVIKLTNKEIANFLVQSRSAELSANELKALRELHFDEVRAAQWAVQKLKLARSTGEQISFAQILEQIQTPKPKSSPKAKREKRIDGTTSVGPQGPKPPAGTGGV